MPHVTLILLLLLMSSGLSSCDRAYLATMEKETD